VTWDVLDWWGFKPRPAAGRTRSWVADHASSLPLAMRSTLYAPSQPRSQTVQRGKTTR
jgi:hypothetical protein